MTKKQAMELAAKALPCPFCGGKMVVALDAKEEFFGGKLSVAEKMAVALDAKEFFLIHGGENYPCPACPSRICSKETFAAWNRRAGINEVLGLLKEIECDVRQGALPNHDDPDSWLVRLQEVIKLLDR